MYPTNSDRADWARQAVQRFADQTRRGTCDLAPGEEFEDVTSDLLCDLRHLCDQVGVDFDALSARGRYHYDAEVAEEAEDSETPAEQLGDGDGEDKA